MNTRSKKIAFVAAGVLAVSALAAPQIKQAIKILGVGAAVKQFSPQINKEINKLSKHTDTPLLSTKVVPILSMGLNTTGTIGAAQVTGPKKLIDKVQAVAEPQAKLFGEITITALIPVSSKDVIKDIKKVDGVGVSGIVDLRF